MQPVQIIAMPMAYVINMDGELRLFTIDTSTIIFDLRGDIDRTISASFHLQITSISHAVTSTSGAPVRKAIKVPTAVRRSALSAWRGLTRPLRQTPPTRSWSAPTAGCAIVTLVKATHRLCVFMHMIAASNTAATYYCIVWTAIVAVDQSKLTNHVLFRNHD